MSGNTQLPDFGEQQPALPNPALGSELTLGLLHEVNNRMTGIFFAIESCLDTPTLAEDLRTELSDVLENLRSSQQLIDRLSEVQLGMREVDFHEASELLRKQLDLLKHLFPKNTKVEVEPGAEELHLRIDEAGFRILLLELATWMRPLVPKTGLLLLRATAAQFAGTGAPAIAFEFLTTGASGTEMALPTLPNLSAYAGELTMRQPDSRGGLEISLLLPRIQLETSDL